MNHLTEDQLNEYLDGLLDEQTRQSMGVHLSQCADCRNQMEQLKQVFADLDDLPEIPLTRDLTPSVMAKLPQKPPLRVWSRTFAAQLGVAAGTFFWLAIQVIPLVKFPHFAFPKLLMFDPRPLAARLLTFRFPMPDLRFAPFSYQLPAIDFQVPALDLRLSTTSMAVLMIAALLLWVVGNVILLQGRQEAAS